MKNSLFKVFILLIIEVAVFWLFSHFLRFPFALAFLQAFIYSSLCAALILEARSKKNSSFWILSLLNLLFIVILFFLIPVEHKDKYTRISNEEYQKIQMLRKETTPYYSLQEKKKIANVFYFLAHKNYEKALDIIDPILKKNDFTQKLHSYILRQKAIYDNFYENAIREIPHFKIIYNNYISNKYNIEFVEQLRSYSHTKPAHFFINLAKKRQTLLTNDAFLEKSRAYEVNEFLKEYNNSESLKHILFISPRTQKYYSSLIAKYETTSFNDYDFRSFNTEYPSDSSDITAVNNIISFAKKQDSNNLYLIRCDKIVFGKNLYPLFAFNLKIASDHKQFIRIPLAKITTHSIVYYENQKVKQIHFPRIYFKMKNSKELLKNPLSISWFSLYKEDFPELYSTMIKPYWKEFWKFMFSLILSLAVSYFVILYFKEGKLQKVAFYYYFLPFVFLMPASLLLMNLIVKTSNFIFRIL